MSLPTPYYERDGLRIFNGDCIDVLRAMPAASVHCVVTSPPYWGLRDYGVDGQIGLEETVDEWVARLVAVFDEVRRVLRDDGTLWLNLGDSYASSPPGNVEGVGRTSGLNGANGSNGKYRETLKSGHAQKMNTVVGGLKSKDLIGQPWMVAFALRAAGWYLRSDIIWHKPSPMPESVRDRPTKAHEYLFLLAKAPRYYFDAEAVREDGAGRLDRWPGPKGRIGGDRHSAQSLAEATGRNLRDVWTIPSEPFPDAHFACVDADTECLTSEGWKRHDEIKPGSLAAQFDIDSQRLSWGAVEDVARYSVTDQEMVVARNRDLRMVLTPNHRCVVQLRHNKTREYQKPVVVRADELKASHGVPVVAEWEPCGDSSLPLEWAELLGWYIAEGYENKSSLAVEIYQSESANPTHCRRIEELLRQTGVEWTRAQAERLWKDRPSVQNAYRVAGYGAMRLRELAPKKRIPVSALMWSHDRCEALLRGLIHGDGHTRQDGRACFVQRGADQIDMFQALAVRCGLAACVSPRMAPGDLWTCYLTKHKTRSFRGTAGAGAPPAVERYSGIVWCPKLPLGTWLARRNGRIFITGNTFPTRLVEPCIKAGTSERGCCPACGAPWVREVESGKGDAYTKAARNNGRPDGGERRNLGGGQKEWNSYAPPSTTGWSPSCACDAGDPIPCTVLDPFGGSGTTGVVAESLLRRAALIELSPEYCAIAKKRLGSQRRLFA